MLKKKMTAVTIVAAAASAFGVNAITSNPANATHGPGLKQIASAALEGGTLVVNPAPIVEVCWGTECVTKPISAGVDSIGVALDYTLLRTSTHLPDVVSSAGLPAACSVKDALGQTRQRAGAVVDLGLGSFESFNGVNLVTRDKNGSTTTELIKPGTRSPKDAEYDPAPLRVCVL